MNQIIVRDAHANCWLNFDNPVEIIEAHKTDEVLECLCYIDKAVSSRGLYAAGMIAYEAAPAFDPALVVREDREFPLLWFGLYAQPGKVEVPKFMAGSVRSGINWRPSISPDEYSRAFERIKLHLEKGDTYQVNYTFRLKESVSSDPWSFFVRLVAAQGSTYGAFMATDKWAVCSASPELFFRLDGTCIESRPMKGTAARGVNHEQDLRQASELQASEKNRAENLMIVDMIRNDMGRIAEAGSVKVPRLFTLEQYPTLWQMTSTVRAETRASLTDIFCALFPPASITGAPKYRTMQIIAELETTPRRIYTGTMGFMAPGRLAQFNVAIRTLLINKASPQAEYGVGGGIVWDSDCDMELSECRTKARILYEATEPFFLLETLLWTPEGGYSLLERHMQRLEQSAAYFDYPICMEDVRRHLLLLSRSLSSSPHKIRLLVSNNGLINSQADPIDLQGYRSSKHVPLARFPVNKSNLFLYHKTTNRRIYEEAISACPGYDDVILHNEDGEVTESTIANVVVDIDGVLYTPPLHCGLLPGTYRAWMLEMKMIEEKAITIDQILRSHRVFLINSVRGMYTVEVISMEEVESPTRGIVERQGRDKRQYSADTL